MGTIPGLERLSASSGLALPSGHVFPQLHSRARGFIWEMLEPPAAPADPKEFIDGQGDLVAVLA